MSEDLSNVEVEVFTYRSVVVTERFLFLPRTLLDQLEEALAKKAGKRPDNHTAYKLTCRNGLGGESVTYIAFSDNLASFGLSIEKTPW
ncbi:MAG: hypothetical protein WCP17_00465 [bacterium]